MKKHEKESICYVDGRCDGVQPRGLWQQDR